jgi:hypothetical protein
VCATQKFENEEKSRSGLLLNSFLILPVQRVPRYMLLLQVRLLLTALGTPVTAIADESLLVGRLE